MNRARPVHMKRTGDSPLDEHPPKRPRVHPYYLAIAVRAVSQKLNVAAICYMRAACRAWRAALENLPPASNTNRADFKWAIIASVIRDDEIFFSWAIGAFDLESRSKFLLKTGIYRSVLRKIVACKHLSVGHSEFVEDIIGDMDRRAVPPTKGPTAITLASSHRGSARVLQRMLADAGLDSAVKSDNVILKAATERACMCSSLPAAEILLKKVIEIVPPDESWADRLMQITPGAEIGKLLVKSFAESAWCHPVRPAEFKPIRRFLVGAVRGGQRSEIQWWDTIRPLTRADLRTLISEAKRAHDPAAPKQDIVAALAEETWLWQTYGDRA